MFRNIVAASALAIPLGLFALSSTARADMMWNPTPDWHSHYYIPITKTSGPDRGMIQVHKNKFSHASIAVHSDQRRHVVRHG